jgi:hypothetical protein
MLIRPKHSLDRLPTLKASGVHDDLHHIPVATELQMKTARNRIGEVMEGWRVVAQPRQRRGVLLYEIQHLCGDKRTVYPQDWQRGFVACRKCKIRPHRGVAAEL